jgi:hypothetical protein
VFQYFINNWYHTEIYIKNYTLSGTLHFTKRTWPSVKWCCHLRSLHNYQVGIRDGRKLTFRNRASYIGQAHCYPPNTPFYIIFQQIYVLNFLNMLHTLRFFSSKCRWFHIATVFGSCIICILHTECAKT